MSGDEYEARQAARRNDDFIVDDEGYGYQDKGGEIWDVNDDDEAEAGGKKKRRKLAKDEQTINSFMFNASLKGNKPAVKKAAPVPKVNEQESKDIMNQLYDDLD